MVYKDIFDTVEYLKDNPEVGAAKLCSLLHWESWGLVSRSKCRIHNIAGLRENIRNVVCGGGAMMLRLGFALPIDVIRNVDTMLN